MKRLHVYGLIVSIMLPFAVNGAESGIGELCKNGGVEGSYLAVKQVQSVRTVGQPQSLVVRINLVCVTEDKMIGSEALILGETGLNKMITNSTTSNLGSIRLSVKDSNILEIASFPIDSEPRWEFPTRAVPAIYLVDVAQLKNGKFIASYDGKNVIGFSQTVGKLEQKFPLEQENEALAIDRETYRGSFYVKDSVLGEGYMKLGLAGNMPYVTYVGKFLGENVPLMYGPEWPENKDVHSTFMGCLSLGHAGEPDEAKLYCIRGHYIDKDHVEFHVIVPGFGLSPAYVGTRTNDFQGNVAEIKVPTGQEIADLIAKNRDPAPAPTPKTKNEVAKIEPKAKKAKAKKGPKMAGQP